MKNFRIKVTEKLTIPASSRKVISYLSDPHHLKEFEGKISRVRVYPKSKKQGTYVGKGRFIGFPWRGAFSYILTRNGLYSEMIEPVNGVKAKGGFTVKSRARSKCQVSHFESYELPLFLAPFAFLIRLYLRMSIHQELLTVQKKLMGRNKALSS